MLKKSTRRGAANSFHVLVFGGMIVLVALGFILWRMDRQVPTDDLSSPGSADKAKSPGSLMLYCAAELRSAAEQVAADYQKQYGITPQIQYGGSNTLLSQIAVSKTGDLFLAADDSYIDLGKKQGLIAETFPVAQMRCVIAVQQGNPKKITGIKDLLRPDVVTALANPDQAAIGKKTRQLLGTAGIWDQVEKHVTAHGVFLPTVTEVANSVQLGSADAAIVWDTTVKRTPKLEAVRAPELSPGVAHITLAVLKCSLQPISTLRFARYLASADKGLPIFQKLGYQVTEGDNWSEVPELTFYIGSVNRRAVEPIIDAFQKREGVRVITVYNGCGILTGQMRQIARRGGVGFPDLYLACDVYYLDTVRSMFQEPVNISDTEVVIAVPKGNPQRIKDLKDLGKPGVRVSVGQCEQCTIGVLTRKLLESEDLLGPVQKNVVTETATSAMLVPTVTTKSVDATLAYATDTLAEKDKLDVIHITSPAGKAVQPLSIAKESTQKNLARRLYQSITHSKDSFEKVGFHWRLDDAGQPLEPEKPAEATKPAKAKQPAVTEAPKQKTPDAAKPKSSP